MTITIKALRQSLSPDVAALSAAALAELDAPVSAPAVTRPPTPSAPVPSEHDEQVALFAWAAANEGRWQELRLLLAIPNGGYRPMTTAAMLKAEGVKAGVPDCCLPVARGRYHSLWLEVKRADHSNHATEAQWEWITNLRYCGNMAVVCYGADEAIAVITSYLSLDNLDSQGD